MSDYDKSSSVVKKNLLPLPAEECLPDLYCAAIVGRLTKDFAHQIGNCLFGILGYSEVLLANMADNDPQKRRAKAVEEQALNLKRLIDALSELSNRKESQIELTDIQTFVHHTVKLLQNPAVKAGVTVDETYEQPLPLINLDNAKLKQAVCNLLLYSIMTNLRQQVQVSASAPDGQIEIRISGATPTEDAKLLDLPSGQTGKLTMENLPLHIGRLKVEELGGKLLVILDENVVSFTISLPIDAKQEASTR